MTTQQSQTTQTQGAASPLSAQRIQAPARRHVGRAGAATLRALWAVLACGFAFGAYFVLRYQGAWSEIDTSVFLTAGQRFQDAGHLNYPQPYLHGFAYITWLSALSALSGVPAAALVQVYLPMIGTLLVAFLAFVTFRQLLGSDRLGAISAGTLFLIPELVFTLTRGNHEKIDVSMILTAVLCLLSSVSEGLKRRRPGVIVGWVVGFYAAVYTLLTSNTFFGSTFAAALTLTLAGLSLVLRRVPAAVPVSGALTLLRRRLPLVVGVCWCLVLLVMWYVYPAASAQLQTYKNMVARLATLFLSFETQSNPYQGVTQEWASPLIYRALSSFRWVLFLGSAALWVLLLRRTWRRLTRSAVPRVLLLGLYGAFALLLALSIPVDFLGLAEGSNLQVRLYTYFGLFATPMFVAGTVPLLRAWTIRRATRRRPRLRWPGVLLRVAVMGFAAVSLLKATVDPQVSNLWIFYRPQEVQAMSFFADHDRDALLWVGPRERLVYAFALERSTFQVQGNAFTSGPADPGTPLALASNVIQAHAVADELPLPTALLGSRVYDNGAAQVYRRQPVTPFER